MSTQAHPSPPRGIREGNVPPADAEGMLLEFMRGRDVACPVCGYNLRNLRASVCPECDHRLELRVGVQKVRVLWLLVALIPCAFSGLCALFALALVCFVALVDPSEGGFAAVPLFIWVLDGFGWLSALGALMLIVLRDRFLGARLSTQRIIAAVIWAVHIAAFGLFLNVVVL